MACTAHAHPVRSQAQLEKEAAADRSAWAAATKQSLGERKRSAQPSPEAWASGPHAHRIAALKVGLSSGVPMKWTPAAGMQASMTLCTLCARLYQHVCLG
jgi:hypothetical protein